MSWADVPSSALRLSSSAWASTCFQLHLGNSVLTCFSGGRNASPEAKPSAGLLFPSQNSGWRPQCSWITQGHCAAGLWGFQAPYPLCLQKLPSLWHRWYLEWVSRLKISTVYPFPFLPAVMATSQDKILTCKKCYFRLNSLSWLFGDPITEKDSWISGPQLCLERANSGLVSTVWPQIHDQTLEILSIYEAWYLQMIIKG